MKNAPEWKIGLRLFSSGGLGVSFFSVAVGVGQRYMSWKVGIRKPPAEVQGSWGLSVV